MQTVKDSAGKKYINYNDLYFRDGTDERVMRVLEQASKSQVRIRIFLGDPKTGEEWFETNDVMGRVGRTTGQIKVPILVPNVNSWGGTAISTNCIVKITIDRKIVYQCANYKVPQFATKPVEFKGGRGVGVFAKTAAGGKHLASCETQAKADNFIRFLKGEYNRM